MPDVLPGWDPTPCHPHHMSRHLCRKTEKRETYNGLRSQIHSCMKKVLRTGSFSKLSHWGFCPFSAEYHNRQNIEIPSKHVTRQLCHPSRYRGTLMPEVRKVGYCAIYSPLNIWFFVNTSQHRKSDGNLDNYSKSSQSQVRGGGRQGSFISSFFASHKKQVRVAKFTMRWHCMFQVTRWPMPP